MVLVRLQRCFQLAMFGLPRLQRGGQLGVRLFTRRMRGGQREALGERGIDLPGQRGHGVLVGPGLLLRCLQLDLERFRAQVQRPDIAHVVPQRPRQIALRQRLVGLETQPRACRLQVGLQFGMQRL